MFTALQEYLYTDNITNLHAVDQLSLMAVANRLCLPRLLTMVEQFVTSELEKADKKKEDILEEVMMLIEPSQVSLRIDTPHDTRC